jgi:uncharacterized protein
MTTPFFNKEARYLDDVLADYSALELEKLMNISPALAVETRKRWEERVGGTASVKPAVLSYGGTAFKKMDPSSFSDKSLEYAQKHLRILSGRYGILRPLDGISPYRLEMNTALDIPEEGRLKQFWKKRLSSRLSVEAPLAQKDGAIINLASNEYSGALDRGVLNTPFITLQFKERDSGRLRTVGMYAKQARGQMVREILDRGIDNPLDIRDISFEGYQYLPGESRSDEWVFAR